MTTIAAAIQIAESATLKIGQCGNSIQSTTSPLNPPGALEIRSHRFPKIPPRTKPRTKPTESEIKPRICEEPSNDETVEKATRRKTAWQLDEDFEYDPAELDRSVQTPDQIRKVITTFRDRLHTDIFPGRTEVPKTLVFAKDDIREFEAEVDANLQRSQALRQATLIKAFSQ